MQTERLFLSSLEKSICPQSGHLTQRLSAISIGAVFLIFGLTKSVNQFIYFTIRCYYFSAINNGTLMASGMIAGEGIVGIVLALLAVLNVDTDISGTINLGEIGSIVAFIALICVMIYTIESGKKNA